MLLLLNCLLNGVLVILLVVFAGAPIVAFRDEGVGKGILVLVVAGLIAAGIGWFLKSRMKSRLHVFGTLAVAIAMGLTIHFVHEERAGTTDIPDETLRKEIVGQWRVSFRLTAEDRKMTIPDDADFVMQGHQELTFGRRVATSVGELVISAVSQSIGSQEARFDTRDVSTWTIERGRLTLTPIAGKSTWKPKPGHEPTRAFLRRFPAPKPEVDPSKYLIKSMSQTKMVAVLVTKNVDGRTVRHEFVYQRVARPG